MVIVFACADDGIVVRGLPKKLAGLTIIMTAFTIEESRDCIIFLDHKGGRNEVVCVCVNHPKND